MHRLGGAFVAAFLVTVCGGAAGPARSILGATPPPSPEALTPSVASPTLPANSLAEVLNLVTGTLRPLPAEKASLVRITAQAAVTTVLKNERATGWPDLDIAWKDGDCVLLAWFERHPMSYAPVPADPSAVYLVRLVNDSGGATWVMMEASTGELGAAFGGPSISACPS